MEKVVHFSGSICKKETLELIKTNTLENTVVCEATSPYANYYGQLPRSAKPNSIFLFTTKFYFLEEILSCTQNIETCPPEDVNIASAIIEYRNRQYPAIRIKNFPDYSELANLQKCIAKLDIKFLDKLHIEGEVKVQINKLFKVEVLENGFYMDLNEEHKGYFTHDSRITCDNFQEIITQVKNNGNCKLFDAVHGELLVDGKITGFVRVYSEGFNLELLKCIKKEFDRSM